MLAFLMQHAALRSWFTHIRTYKYSQKQQATVTRFTEHDSCRFQPCQGFRTGTALLACISLGLFLEETTGRRLLSKGRVNGHQVCQLAMQVGIRQLRQAMRSRHTCQCLLGIAAVTLGPQVPLVASMGVPFPPAAFFATLFPRLDTLSTLLMIGFTSLVSPALVLVACFSRCLATALPTENYMC